MIQRRVAPGYHSGLRVEPNGSGRGHVPRCTLVRAHTSPRKNQLVTAGHKDTGTRWRRYSRRQRLPGCQGKSCYHGLLFASVLLVESKPKLVFGDLWSQLNQNCHKTLKKREIFSILQMFQFIAPILFPLSYPYWVSTYVYFARLALEGKTIKTSPGSRCKGVPNPGPPSRESKCCVPRAVPSAQTCEGDTGGLGGLSCLALQDKKSHQSQKSFPPAICWTSSSPFSHMEGGFTVSYRVDLPAPLQGRGCWFSQPAPLLH